VARHDKLTVMPRLRFPEFRSAPGWDCVPGDALFASIGNRPAAAGLPILAITQEHGAIPRDQIDYHVSVTEKSLGSYKVVEEGDFIISLRSFQGSKAASNTQTITVSAVPHT
jgi:type I restriction enzyme, S subunit